MNQFGGRIDPSFYELMPTKAQISFYTGKDAHGNDQYAAAKPYWCRVEPASTTRNVSTNTSDTKLSAPGRTLKLIIDYIDGVKVPVSSKVVVPQGTYTVITETVFDDEDGPYYQELDCGNNEEP